MSSPGFSTTAALVIILSLSIMIIQSGGSIANTSSLGKRLPDGEGETEIFSRELDRLMMEFKSNPSPEGDSFFDPIWNFVKKQTGIYKGYSLEDLSSRINPAWVHPLLLERTELKTILLPDVTPQEFRDERTALGYSLNINENFKNLVKPEALEKYCTPYSFMNVNTAYEFALEDIYYRITGDTSGAVVFHTMIERALKEKLIITDSDLKNSLGTKAREIYPLIGTLPEMNINHVPAFILKGILDYPFGGKKIENKRALYERIITARKNHEISPEELRNLIPDKTSKRIFCYLGTKTWFWKVTITSKKNTMEAVITCFPEGYGDNGIKGKHRRFLYRLYSFKLTRSN